jgi:hypothetical protein
MTRPSPYAGILIKMQNVYTFRVITSGSWFERIELESVEGNVPDWDVARKAVRVPPFGVRVGLG